MSVKINNSVPFFLQFAHGANTVEDIEIGKQLQFHQLSFHYQRETKSNFFSPLPPVVCISEVPQLSQDSGGPLPVPVQVPVPVLPPLNDAVLDDIPLSNSISSLPSSEPPSFEPVPLPVSVPTSVSLPAPTMVNGSRTSKPCPLPESSQDYDAEIIGDDLDDLLDQAGPPEPAMVSADMKSISLMN